VKRRALDVFNRCQHDENSRVKGYNEFGFFQVLEVIGQATGFRGCDDTCIRVDRVPVRHIFVTR